MITATDIWYEVWADGKKVSSYERISEANAQFSVLKLAGQQPSVFEVHAEYKRIRPC